MFIKCLSTLDELYLVGSGAQRDSNLFSTKDNSEDDEDSINQQIEF